jgi:hypothetical protein
MKQTLTIPCWSSFFLACVLTLLPATSVLAKSAWHWEMSLYVNTPGDAMYMPAAVSFEPTSERYYAVDAGNNRLVSFNRNGELLNAFNADNQLLVPFDMVRLDNGQLWVVEKGRNSLTHVDVRAQTIQPHKLLDGDRQVFPDRIALEGGKLYILDRASGQVLRLSDDLKVEQHFGCADCLGGFVDFVINDNSVWALENISKNVYQFNSDGTIAQIISLGDSVDFPV